MCFIIEVVDLYTFKQQQHNASISLQTRSKHSIQVQCESEPHDLVNELWSPLKDAHELHV